MHWFEDFLVEDQCLSRKGLKNTHDDVVDDNYGCSIVHECPSGVLVVSTVHDVELWRQPTRHFGMKDIDLA
jgi:hypothetical protein